MSDNKISLGQAIDQMINALEGLDQNARLTAISAVCAQLNIGAPFGAQPHVQVSTSPPTTEPTKEATMSHQSQLQQKKKVDIRSLKEEKNPDSAKQMACLVAYYLQDLAPEGERRDAISTHDLKKYFKEAGFKLPTKLEQVLLNAKSSGYFESAARGKYKLNAVGYNLVVHGLPAKKAS